MSLRPLIDIELPLAPPNLNMLNADGSVLVRVALVANVTQVKVMIVPEPSTPPVDPPAYLPYVQVTANPLSIPGVPGARGGLGNDFVLNYVRVWQYDVSNTLLATSNKEFRAQTPPTTTVRVSAKCCPWFAWAPVGAPLTSSESGVDLETLRPVAVTVPPTATSVTIAPKAATTVPDRRWRHGTSDMQASGPSGLDGSDQTPTDSRGLENVQYQSGNYYSDMLVPLSTHLNKLIAIVEDSDSPTAQTPTIVGTGPVAIPLTPNSTSRIFLAMHDGHEWKNNSGEVEVDLDWS